MCLRSLISSNQLPRCKRAEYEDPILQGKRNAASGGELNPNEIKIYPKINEYWLPIHAQGLIVQYHSSNLIQYLLIN
jgi:hypothetical protein